MLIVKEVLSQDLSQNRKNSHFRVTLDLEHFEIKKESGVTCRFSYFLASIFFEGMIQPIFMRRRNNGVIKPGDLLWIEAQEKDINGGLCFLPILDSPKDRKPVGLDREIREHEADKLRNYTCIHFSQCLTDAAEHISGGKRARIVGMETWFCSLDCPYRTACK